MRKLILVCTILSLCSCANPYQDTENNPEDYGIIPKPVNIAMNQGRFVINDETTISGDEGLEREGKFLSDLIQHAFGKTITYEASKDLDENSIELKIDETLDHEEGYLLKVTPGHVIITGKTAKGVFYGIESLRQLINNADDEVADVTIPAVSIEDYPRFEYRGMHLDVCRHFFPVEFVKEYIDLIALHKMNTFHWHLTDDQGWRIEIKQYPKLTEIGGMRNGTIVGHYPGTENDQKETSGFYTQEQIKDVVNYASDRHVTVIPEIELPGHSSAAIAAYPYLSCFPEEKTVVDNNMMSDKSKELQANGTPKVVQETWGVFDDVYCAGKDETFTFLENVLTEVMDLFPSHYIHIGGDESPKANWERCPDCQKRIADLNLKNEHELQSYFIQRIEKFVNSEGKSIIGWDEILEGGLAPNATVMSWRGIEGGIDAAQQGHDVIMTPNEFCYFDKYQGDPEGEPLSIGGLLTVEKVYGYEPEPTELTAEESKFIMGAQGNVWTEYMDTTDYVEYMILPRMTALSEVVWSPKKDRNYADFKQRLADFEPIYKEMGVDYATHSLE
ncbi:MAG: beta-N-acetylhexosaminidase [Leeuwenhoekiella sp.]